MLLKSLLVLIASAFLTNFPLQVNNDNVRADSQLSYAKLEVRGTRLNQGPIYYIQTHDSFFTDVKLLVRLERSEDKNRILDRHLEKLLGKSVLAKGLLDCRRVGQEKGVIYMHLSNESQITATGDK